MPIDLSKWKGTRGALPSPYDPSDPVFPNITAEQAAALPSSVDLRQYDSPVRNQDGVGCCVAAASCGVFEWLVRKLDMSAWFKTSMLAIYYWARLLDGMESSDGGTYPKSAITAMTNTGMAHDSLWPFGSETNCNAANYPEPTNVNTAPTSNVTADAAKNKVTKSVSVATGVVVTGSGDSVITVMGLDDAKNALASGYPVMFILCADEYDPLMHSSPMSGQSYGLIPNLSDWTTLPDHGQIMMGYDDSITNADSTTGAFIVKNSWSTLWGDWVSGETKIPLLSGKDVPIRSLLNAAPFWVYAYDTDRKKIVPAQATACKRAHKNVPTVTVYLDNDEHITCTPDHPFLLRDGTYKKAEKLNEGDSLMPFYRSYDKDGYTKIACNSTFSWVRAHWTVAREIRMFEEHKGRAVIHHINFDKTDNTPENLLVMSPEAHSSYHSQLKDNTPILEAWDRNYDEWVKNSRKNITRYNELLKNGEAELTERQRAARRRNAITLNKSGTPEERSEKAKRAAATRKKGGAAAYAGCGIYERTEAQSKQAREMCSKLAEYRWYKNAESEPLSYNEWAATYNHKVLKVERHERIDTYDICVPRYHNFATSAGVFIHNSGYGYLPYAYANNSAVYDGWIITGESQIVVPTPGPTPGGGGAPNVNLNVNVRGYQPGVE